MAKGIGLIGNFRGKVGNMVGYNLKDSNNKQTQGVRVYQPIVKNPKTYGQAEQRAKLAPINATYRALKMIIDRGQEGKAYGNKSRLAWLSAAMKADDMPWFVKGASVNYPVGCQLTKGSLSGFSYRVFDEELSLNCAGVTSESNVSTIGGISTLLKAGYPTLSDGDQVTFVTVAPINGNIAASVFSIVINPSDTTNITSFTADTNELSFTGLSGTIAGSIIVSREGANGEHLRSTEILNINSGTIEEAPYDADSKAAAIKSYMVNGSNTDWAEESLQG